MKVFPNRIIQIHYRLKDSDGKVLEDTFSGRPVMFVFGKGHLPAAIENSLAGQFMGDKVQVQTDANEAFGARDESLVHVVPLSDFKDPNKLRIGMEFQLETEHSKGQFWVKEIRPEEALVDGNHPWAGKELNWDIEIVEVRLPTDEEKKLFQINSEDKSE